VRLGIATQGDPQPDHIVVALLGCLAYDVLIPTIEPIVWPERPPKLALAPR